MSKKAKTSKATKAKAAKKPSAKQRALAAINNAMNEPLSPAAHDITDQANPNLADTQIHSEPAEETQDVATADSAEAPAKEKKPSGLDLAAQVLKKAGEPLNAKQILDGCLAAGWQTKGATPGATLYAAILRECMQKGTASRFRKAERGKFTVVS